MKETINTDTNNKKAYPRCYCKEKQLSRLNTFIRSTCNNKKKHEKFQHFRFPDVQKNSTIRNVSVSEIIW